MPRNQKEYPGGKKKTLEPMGMPWKPQPTSMKPTISSLDPTGQVNLLLDVKVISSQLSGRLPFYKRPHTLQAGGTRSFPLHFMNFLSSLLTPL
jgi:hypothetical protein